MTMFYKVGWPRYHPWFLASNKTVYHLCEAVERKLVLQTRIKDIWN